MKKLLFLFVLQALLTSCAVHYTTSSKKFASHVAQNKVFEKEFLGFCVYDMDSKKYVVEYQSNKYFTPASNTKLFTFYACLKAFGSQAEARVPALHYADGDKFTVWGTANPTFLHPDFQDSSAITFLKAQPKTIHFSNANYTDAHLGDGWAWDDYPYAYGAEKSPLPMYGNVVQFSYQPEKPNIIFPTYFNKVSKQGKMPSGSVYERLWHKNEFVFNTAALKKNYTTFVPFHTDSETIVAILADTLKKEVLLTETPLQNAKILWGAYADSIYRPMLQDSDNFLAEHLLMMCASVVPELKGELNTANVIRHTTQKYLKDLPDSVRWVDGSGLSRMNLFTPRALVSLLLKIHQEMAQHTKGEQRLFNLLPTGGRTGTLKSIYKKYPPFVYAKTGTLSNNHSLSGFLVTKSGKKLCFSFMNNHYLQPTASVRTEMERILTDYYLNY